MTDFTLKIQFSKADTISLNQQGYLVAIVKGQQTAATVNQVPVWVTFAPFENNLATWDSIYGLFGSPDPAGSNAPITTYSSEFPVESGAIYPFQYNSFGKPEAAGEPNTYNVQNADGRKLTFGLLQSITANGVAHNAQPTSATAIETNMNIQLLPSDTVSIFMFNVVQNGVVIITNETALLDVDMKNNPQQTIHFDGQQFVVGALP